MPASTHFSSRCQFPGAAHCNNTSVASTVSTTTSGKSSFTISGSGHGLAVASSRTDHDEVVVADWTRLRTVRGSGLDMVSDRSRARSVRGLNMDMFAVMDKLRSWSRTGKATATWPDFVGRVPATAQTLRWKLRGQLVGCCVTCGIICQRGCSVSAQRIATRTSVAIARTLHYCRPAIARTTHRTLGGRDAGLCADIARLAALPSCKGMVSNQNDRLSHSRKPPRITFG